jgi:hypothetical protein
MPFSSLILKNNHALSCFFLVAMAFCATAQINTASPYSRYGVGERAQQTPAHNQAMGGAFIALKPDSSMPVFINTGNAAAYSLIRLTTLEVGGRYAFSDHRSAASGVRKWGTNFTYATLGFPVGGRGGGVLGMMPYSYVGYNTQYSVTAAAGDITYQYAGNGGLNRAFLGYGVMPFSRSHRRFLIRNVNVPDSVPHLTGAAFRAGSFFTKLLSDLSLGANANYVFGNVQHTARIVYPNILLYNNTFSERSYFVGGFTGNFGAQTAFTIDSVNSKGPGRRALVEKAKITFGYFITLNNTLRAFTNAAAYNYIYNTSGQEIVRDTVQFVVDQRYDMTLPLEQGFGIGYKKGERLNVVADFAVTVWDDFRAPHQPGFLRNSFRTGAGVQYVPEKQAAGRGAIWKRCNYRFGAGYHSGDVSLAGRSISTMFVSAGIGLPVGIGRMSSMINVALQAGQTGTTASGLVKENFFRVHVGFTFCDRWFQKFRYD